MVESGPTPNERDEPCGEFCGACEEETFCPLAYSGNCLRFYSRMDIPRSAY